MATNRRVVGSKVEDDGCGVVAVGCLLIILVVVGWTFFSSWLIMLALGGIANQTGRDCAYGFWMVWLAMFVISSIAGLFRSNVTVNK